MPHQPKYSLGDVVAYRTSYGDSIEVGVVVWIQVKGSKDDPTIEYSISTKVVHEDSIIGNDPHEIEAAWERISVHKARTTIEKLKVLQKQMMEREKDAENS